MMCKKTRRAFVTGTPRVIFIGTYREKVNPQVRGMRASPSSSRSRARAVSPVQWPVYTRRTPCSFSARATWPGYSGGQLRPESVLVLNMCRPPTTVVTSRFRGLSHALDDVDDAPVGAGVKDHQTVFPLQNQGVLMDEVVLDKLVGTQLAQQIGFPAGEGTTVDGLRYQPHAGNRLAHPLPAVKAVRAGPPDVRWDTIKRGEPVEVEK